MMYGAAIGFGLTMGTLAVTTAKLFLPWHLAALSGDVACGCQNAIKTIGPHWNDDRPFPPEIKMEDERCQRL